MARGWESKGVEDQVAEAEARKEAAARPQLSQAERESRARREGLMLSRARIEGMLAAAREPRHREQLERALADLDADLARMG